MPQCSLCGRTFARNEHLARHLRIHTGERPFLCPHCGVGFQRPDVLSKHVEKLHPQHAPAAEAARSHRADSKGAGNKPRDRERSRLACDQCRKRKLKCDNVRPCTSCRTKLLNCTVSSLSRPPGRPRMTAPLSPPASQIVSEPAAGGKQTAAAVADQTEADTADTTETETTEPAETAETASPCLFPPWSAGSEGDATMLPRLPSPDISTAVPIDTPSLRDGYPPDLDPMHLTLPGGEPWMTPRPPGLPSVPGPFGPDVLHLAPSCDAINLFDELMPSGDFGSWLDDLRDVSGSDIWPQGSMELDPDFHPCMEGAIDLLTEQLQQQCRSRGSSPSQAAQQRSWYSALPQLSIYDAEIVNVLLNVATRHLSTTFALFADFAADPGTRVDLCLAMAAVGGLYCTHILPDSTKVVKMLFNDARRLLLEDYLDTAGGGGGGGSGGGGGLSFDEALSFAKTFILLELYGIGSGDKRAYEFAEVFHGSKLHAVTCCFDALPTPDDAPTATTTTTTTTTQRRQAQLLREAIRILDGYRVLLLQRPPSFEDEGADGAAADGRRIRHLSPSGGIVSAGRCQDHPDPAPADMGQLATIVRYSWMASPRGDASGTTAPPLWKTDFVRHALDRWIQAKTAHAEDAHGPVRAQDVPQMLLFHLTHMTLHSHMPALQRLAQAALHAGSASKEDAAAGHLARPRDGNSAVQPWASKRPFQMALWHARQILDMAQGSVPTRPGRRGASLGRAQQATAEEARVEPPHLPLCVYFATLVVWYAETRSPWGVDTVSVDTVSGGLSTETGWQLLSHMRLPVSAILAKTVLGLAQSRGDGRHGVSLH